MKCVEHPRRPMSDVQTTGFELLDVAGKQPVVAVRRGAGDDGSGQRRADPFPAVPRRVQRKPATRRMSRPGARLANDDLHGLIEEGRRNRERLGDHGGEIHRFGPVDHEQGSQREKQEQAQAGQRIAVDVEACAVPRRGEGRIGEGLPAPFFKARRYLEVDQYHSAVRPQQDVERVQIPDDDAALVHRIDRPFELGLDIQCPRRVLGDGPLVGVELN